MDCLIFLFSYLNRDMIFINSGAKVLLFFEIYKYSYKKISPLCTKPYTLCI